MADDLASGFQSVDAAADFAVFSDCLTLVDSLPFFADCKRESYDLLGAMPGSRILDVGCGLGTTRQCWRGAWRLAARSSASTEATP